MPEITSVEGINDAVTEFLQIKKVAEDLISNIRQIDGRGKSLLNQAAQVLEKFAGMERDYDEFKQRLDEQRADLERRRDELFAQFQSRAESLRTELTECEGRIVESNKSYLAERVELLSQFEVNIQNSAQAVEVAKSEVLGRSDQLDRLLTEIRGELDNLVVERLANYRHETNSTIKGLIEDLSRRQETIDTVAQATRDETIRLQQQLEESLSVANHKIEQTLTDAKTSTDERVEQILSDLNSRIVSLEAKLEDAVLKVTRDVQNKTEETESKQQQLEESLSIANQRFEQIETNAHRSINQRFEKVLSDVASRFTSVDSKLEDIVQNITSDLQERAAATDLKQQQIEESLSVANLTIEQTVSKANESINERLEKVLTQVDGRLTSAEATLKEAVQKVTNESQNRAKATELKQQQFEESLSVANLTIEQTVINANTRIDQRLDKGLTDLNSHLVSVEAK